MQISDLKYIFRSIIPNRLVHKHVKGEWYYFIHIPKTAGTTFRYVLYDYFDNAIIHPNAYEYFILQKAQYLTWGKFIEKRSSFLKSRKRFLIGHYSLEPIDHFHNDPPRTLCFFRDPVKRVVSSVLYHKKRNRNYSNLTIDEVLDKHLKNEGCTQARYLGYTPEEPNLKIVLDNIEKLNIVGISEQFDRSLKLCNQTFGWNLKYDKARNVGNYNPSIFSEEQINRIKEGIKVDQIIYDYALKLFEKRCEKFNI